jgi:hypothetical protein
VKPETFKLLLSTLLRTAAEGGLDCFYIHIELSLAGMALVDKCRVDLVEVDEAQEETPY